MHLLLSGDSGGASGLRVWPEMICVISVPCDTWAVSRSSGDTKCGPKPLASSIGAKVCVTQAV